MSRAELAAMGERGKRFYSTRMSQQVGVMALERVLADAAQTKR
jgi:hypothetical protein